MTTSARDISQYPDLYDFLSPSAPDCQFVEDVAAHRRVLLEPTVGTGRLAIALARRGFTVIGVDRSRKMLSRLARKVRSEPEMVRRRLSWLVGDMRSLAVDVECELVYVPNSDFYHLLSDDDQRAALLAFRRHLKRRDGRLLLWSFNFWRDVTRETLFGNRSRWYPFRFITSHDSCMSVREWWMPRFDVNTQVLSVRRRFDILGNRPEAGTSLFNESAWRVCSVDELQRRLLEAGFKIDDIYGDFTRETYGPASRLLIYVASLC